MPNRFVSAVALALICSVAAFVPAASLQKKKPDFPTMIELGKFQGTWQYASAEQDGKLLMKRDEFKTIKFDRSTYLAMLGDKIVQAGTVSVDSKASPKTIDFVDAAGAKQLGIYEFDGDTLRMHIDPKGQNRPREFKAATGTGYVYSILKEYDVMKEGASPKGDASVIFDRPHPMTSGFYSFNGWAYDKTALSVDPKMKLVLPIKGTEIAESGQADVVQVFMEKRMLFGSHIQKTVSIVEKRREMGCVAKLENGEILIGTFGEGGNPEASWTMKLIILVPPKMEVSRRIGLLGGAVGRKGRPPELINPPPGADIPALTKTKPGTTDCWLAPTVEDGWHEIPAVADVERKASGVKVEKK